MLNKDLLEFELEDVLNITKKDIFLSMNCHAIGKVTKFNSSEQTAEVQINYGKKFHEADPNKKGLTRVVIKDYPLLLDCPVVTITGGAAGLTMPIKAGDDCLVLFNDRDIDNWFDGLTKGAVQSPRLHSMSDGIALVGIRSLKNSIASFDADNPVLFNENLKITVKTDTILIENSVETLNTLIQDLITEVKNILVVGSSSDGASINGTVSPASQALIDLIGTRIGSLLE